MLHGRKYFRSPRAALDHNTSLKVLHLSDPYAQGRCGAFAGALAANASLEELHFFDAAILDSDLDELSNALRRNRTLKVLGLPREGFTAQGLQTLLETVRYHNSSLERVILPVRLGWRLRSLFDSACRFNAEFRCGEPSPPRVWGGAKRRRRGIWTLVALVGVEQNHPTAKATVLFCVVRVRAEIVAHSPAVRAPLPRWRKRRARKVIAATNFESHSLLYYRSPFSGTMYCIA